MNSFGAVGQDIFLSALGSHDPDNAYQRGGSSEGGVSSLGITDYRWEVIKAPANCVPPALESGPSSYMVTLYPAGTAIDPACLGIWRIRLTVTDDDSPALTNSVETLIGIGNCPQTLCIDYPTEKNPLRIEFTDNADIFVYYHVDSALLDAPDLLGGGLAQLDIYHNDDLTTPVYTAREFNVLATDRGGQLVFHWNGYTNDFQRPREGRYTLRITLISLADDISGSVLGASTEANAIWIATAEPRILETSDQNVSVEALANGDDQVDLKYHIEGNVEPDELRWSVYDDRGDLVIEGRMAPEPTGSIAWSGRNLDGSIVAPGNYTAQLRLFRGGVDVGSTESYAFMIFQTSIQWGKPLETWDRVLGWNDELHMYIKTTPKQLTVAEILQIGFPLKLHSRFTFPFGQQMTIFSSANGATSAMLLLPSGTTSAIPSTANIVDTPQGIEFSFAKSLNPLIHTEQDSTDEFASSDWVKDPTKSNYSDSDAFIGAMITKHWRETGSARENGDYASLHTAANKQFIIHAGTEPIWFSLWGKESEKRQVRQQADWFYYSGHGQHSTGELLTPTGPISAADTLWKGDLDVVIIAGCSVLDIKDYRAKSFTLISAAYVEWLAAGGASSPGEAWEATGPKYLLGYAWRAPLDTQGSAEIISRFSLAVDNGNSIVEAWRIANDLPTGRNAVAIDTSKTPHEYCYWDETQGTPNWRCIQKTVNGWPEIP